MLSSVRTISHLIDGVLLHTFAMHRDRRGSFTEIFRRQWNQNIDPVQWNIVHSSAGTLRGVHVHIRHTDYLIVVQGRSTIGLRDLRHGSPTEGLSGMVHMSGKEITAIWIPPGIAHGFYFPEPSVHLYCMTEYWNPAEEMGCHWSDPILEFIWELNSEPIVSPRDASLPSLHQLLNQLEPYQSLFLRS